MLVTIWIDTSRNEYEDNGYYAEVDVPLKDIAEILAERYDISPQAMYMIICDYDLDLTEDIENNEYIKDLAYDIYLSERE